MKRWGAPGRSSAATATRVQVHAPLPGEGGEDRTPQLTDYKCELCGSPMMRRWGRNGWFLGCSTYPKCKSTRSMPLGVTCPKCGGEIIEIKGKKARRPFYGCTNYSKEEIKCDFRSWRSRCRRRAPSAGGLVEAGIPVAILRCLLMRAAAIKGSCHCPENPTAPAAEGGAVITTPTGTQAWSSP
jgi:ssDNA-binding Zn-finger/Zn-ribbon topoisomerase 1